MSFSVKKIDKFSFVVDLTATNNKLQILSVPDRNFVHILVSVNSNMETMRTIVIKYKQSSV
jgi:hypothetical protein